ncbi:helix-turn-helix domain-containing protein [Williamsia sp. SKLECPSW1]
MTAAQHDDKLVGRFVWEQAVRSMPMHPTHKLVGLLLATYGDAAGGSIFPSVERLAADIGRSERTVNRAMDDLRERGLIVVVKRSNQYAAEPSQRTTHYRLALPEGLWFMPPRSDTDVVSSTAQHVVDNPNSKRHP